MSIRRFDIQGWDIDFVLADDGDHVLFEDYQAEVERLREALRAIRDQEWTENALDPQWAGRIARAALAGEGDG
jgi:hypothetical protein